MHYRDGSEAKVGHVILGPEHQTSPRMIGTVVGTMPAATACNLQVVPVALIYGTENARVVVPASTGGTAWTLTAGECSRIA